MPANQKTVAVDPESDLGWLLRAAQASGEPVVVDTGESRYTLFVALAEPTRDLFAGYNPQAAIAGLSPLDDALAGVDREELLRDLHAQRAQNSTGRPG